MELLQRIYILVLNPLYKIVIKVPEKIRNGIICFCFAMVFAIQILYRSKVLIWADGGVSQTQQAMIGTFILCIIILFSLNQTMTRISINKALSRMWIACGMIILVISFIHPVGDGFRALALSMLITFPCLWFVWANRGDYGKLFELAAKGFVLVVMIYFIYCILFVPLDCAAEFGGRYPATVKNPNFLAFFSTVTFFSSLYLIANKNRYIGIYIAVCGVTTIFTALTVSRTSFICCLFGFLGFLVFYIKVALLNDTDRTKEAIKLVTICVVVVASFSAVLIANDSSISSADSDLFNQQILTAENTDGTVTDAGEKISFDRLEQSGNDINSLSSGRIGIWKTYISNLNLLGHNGNERLYSDEYGKILWAHNTALELGYRTGIINCILFFIIEIIMGITAVKYIFLKKYRKTHYLFTALSVGSFCVYSVLEVAVFPFYAPTVFLFFIGIGPLFFKTDSRREQHQHAS